MRQIFLLLLVIVSLCGCVGPQNMNPDKIFFTGQSDIGIIQNISVDEIYPEQQELKKITINGVAYTDATIYYSVVWFDKDNMKINTSLSKSTLEHLRKNQHFYWTAVAPNQQAVSYKVYISDRAI